MFEIFLMTMIQKIGNLKKKDKNPHQIITWNQANVMLTNDSLHTIYNIILLAGILKIYLYFLNLVRVLLLLTMTIKFPLLENLSTVNKLSIVKREAKILYPLKLWVWILVTVKVLLLVGTNILSFQLISVQHNHLSMAWIVPPALMFVRHYGNSLLIPVLFHILFITILIHNWLVERLLHCCALTVPDWHAVPPRHQDKNSLVKNKWQSLMKMACSFLAKSKLPKKFWYQALCEAKVWMNLLPIT